METPKNPNPLGEKSRKLARLCGWIHSVVHVPTLLLAIFLSVSIITMGYEMYGDDSAKRSLVYYDPDTDSITPVPVEMLSQLNVDENVLYFGIPAMHTGIFLFCSVLHSYGAYLLMQATKMNAKTSEAIAQVGTHQKIQYTFAWINVASIIIDGLKHSAGVVVETETLFSFIVLLLSYVSIQCVNRFRNELLAAEAYAIACNKIK